MQRGKISSEIHSFTSSQQPGENILNYLEGKKKTTNVFIIVQNFHDS